MNALLVLCEQDDQSAAWVARSLPGPVEVVTAPMLVTDCAYEHRIRGDVAEVELTLADGRRISSRRPASVLNRLSHGAAETLRARADDGDGDYAALECHALFLSWLTALPGAMVNRPAPHFLAGHWRNPAGWAMLAARAGLPTWTRSPSAGVTRRPDGVTVFVVAGQVIGPAHLPAPVRDACARLGALSRDTLLGVTLSPAWVFEGATPLPDLRAGGRPLLAALAAVLGVPS